MSGTWGGYALNAYEDVLAHAVRQADYRAHVRADGVRRKYGRLRALKRRAHVRADGSP